MPDRKTKPPEARSPPSGRPSSFSQQAADLICDRIANGESLRSICSDEQMPHQATVFRWLAKEEHLEFREQYTHARATQADVLFDEILDIADNSSNDWMRQNRGDNEAWVLNGEALRRSHLRVEARKWMLGKMLPKKYGERIVNEHSGPNGGPIQTAEISDADRAKALHAFLLKTQAPADVQGAVQGTFAREP